jgi:hypothetical protein
MVFQRDPPNPFYRRVNGNSPNRGGQPPRPTYADGGHLKWKLGGKIDRRHFAYRGAIFHQGAKTDESPCARGLVEYHDSPSHIVWLPVDDTCAANRENAPLILADRPYPARRANRAASVGGLFSVPSPSFRPCAHGWEHPRHNSCARMTAVIAPSSLNLRIVSADILKPGDLRARHLTQRRRAIIFRSGGVAHSGRSGPSHRADAQTCHLLRLVSFRATRKRPRSRGNWGRTLKGAGRGWGDRHGHDVGSQSAVTIKLSVTVACFEITSGLFRPVPGVLACFQASGHSSEPFSRI